MLQKVAFVGLGQMGARMAARLVARGHEVVAYDTSRAHLDAFLSSSRGAVSSAASPRAAASAAGEGGVVITMLPSASAVHAVYEGVLDGASPRALLIDCSTIAPADSRAVCAAAGARGSRFIDAPVSGGVGGAEAGTLTFMCGGDAGAVDAARPVLGAMGKLVAHVGASGAGSVAKVVNNMILGATMASVAEAFALGAKLGVAPGALHAIVNASSGRCWTTEVYAPVPGLVPAAPASRGYAGGFAMAHMAKDMGLALDAARAAGAPVPAAAAAAQLYALALARPDLADKDFSAVYALLSGAVLPVTTGDRK